jgi:hypothetical protein
MKYFKSTALILISILFFSCGHDKTEMMELKREPEKDKIVNNSVGNEEAKSFFNADSTAPQIPTPDEKKQPTQTTPAANPDWNKKIIKTADLNFELKEYEPFNNSVQEKIKQTGGYIASEEQTQSEYKIENSMTIKVPVDQFDNAVTLLSNGIKKINEKKITSQDVTTEVVDTKSRLESKKQIRLRYLELLKQAKNMEDILSVQSEINGIQEEMESAAGRVEYLNHSSSFSTINLTFYQVLNPSAKDTDNPSFGTKLSSAFKTGWSWVGDLFVGLVSIWPLLFLVFVAIIFYKRMKVTKTKQA